MVKVTITDLEAARGAATNCLATADNIRCFFKLGWATAKPKGVDEFGREAVRGLTEAAKLVTQARECLTFAVNAAIARANPGPCYVWNDIRYVTAHQAAVYVLRGVMACSCEALIETEDAATLFSRLPDQDGEWFLCPDRIAAAFGGFTGDPQALWQTVHDHLDALPCWDIQGADIMREAANAIAAADGEKPPEETDPDGLELRGTEPPAKILDSLTGDQQKLLRYLWNRDNVPLDKLQRAVWKDKPVSDQAIKQAGYRLGEAICRHRMAVKVNKAGLRLDKGTPTTTE
ncbi:MAG: hypothetical protein KJZ78_30090 [Bryobacteraceae bacterium]|nr:hypothetical protein [Bryobacteraceae bacterium]